MAGKKIHPFVFYPFVFRDDILYLRDKIMGEMTDGSFVPSNLLLKKPHLHKQASAFVKNIKKPKLVGVWILAVTPQQELIKWGLNGDTVFPFPPEDETIVRKCADNLQKSDTHKDDVFYILHVFDNGQMKQFTYESP